MMLRLILVGLVTSMGLELPSGRDVSCWAESGRAWASATICDLTGAGVEVAPAAEPVAAVLPAPAPAPSDLAFQAVAEELAANLAADRAVAAPDELPADTARCDGSAAEAIEVVAVGLPTGEEVAAVAPAEMATVEVVVVGLADGEEVAALVAVAPAAELAPVAPVAQPTAEEDEDASPSHADRLAEAVRLTREAAHAWADLIQEPAAEAGCDR